MQLKSWIAAAVARKGSSTSTHRKEGKDGEEEELLRRSGYGTKLQAFRVAPLAQT